MESLIKADMKVSVLQNSILRLGKNLNEKITHTYSYLLQELRSEKIQDFDPSLVLNC